MASIGAKAEMEKVARTRLTAAIGTLSGRFALTPAEPRQFAGDGHLRGIYELEDMATLLEGLVKATATGGEPFTSNVVTMQRVDPNSGKATDVPPGEPLPDDAFIDVVIGPETEEDAENSEPASGWQSPSTVAVDEPPADWTEPNGNLRENVGAPQARPEPKAKAEPATKPAPTRTVPRR